MKHTRLTRMSKNQLHNTLLKRNLSPARIKEIKEWVAHRKDLINKARVEKQIRQRRWSEMIRPLSYQIAVSKTNKAYHDKNNNELGEFYDDYIKLLETTRAELTKHKLDRQYTPVQLSKQLNKPLNNWTDFIDQETKEDYTQRYDSIPYKSKYSRTRRVLFPKPHKG